MNPEEFLKFLLNQFIPEGMNEDDLPTWVGNLKDKFMSSVISFIFFYIIIFFILTSILSLTGLDFVTSISGAATSISNVGPGLGDIIGPNGNFSSLSNTSKWALSLGMILGRLELFAILVLFIPSFWRKF